jgi:hypothetical protein
MISSHRMTLAMVQAARWSGGNIQTFKWAELDLALSFLGVPPERCQAVRELAEQLRNGSVTFDVGGLLSARERPTQGRGDSWHESPE